MTSGSNTNDKDKGLTDLLIIVISETSRYQYYYLYNHEYQLIRGLTQRFLFSRNSFANYVWLNEYPILDEIPVRWSGLYIFIAPHFNINVIY